MLSKTVPLIGWSLLCIGVIHSVFGVIAGWGILAGATRDGLIGVWDDPPERGLAFWFLMTGFILIPLGLLVSHLERTGVALPWPFIATFGLLTVVGIALLPASGFWLLLLPATLAAFRRLQDTAQETHTLSG